jgi:hypothetical protein
LALVRFGGGGGPGGEKHNPQADGRAVHLGAAGVVGDSVGDAVSICYGRKGPGAPLPSWVICDAWVRRLGFRRCVRTRRRTRQHRRGEPDYLARQVWRLRRRCAHLCRECVHRGWALWAPHGSRDASSQRERQPGGMDVGSAEQGGKHIVAVSPRTAQLCGAVKQVVGALLSRWASQGR